jgi:erythromycin esterase
MCVVVTLLSSCKTSELSSEFVDGSDGNVVNAIGEVEQSSREPIDQLMVQTIAKYATSIEEMQLPDGVRIVGLGEMTHSNAEFQTLRVDVLKVLVEKYGFRTFALEEDFAIGQKINRYIHGDDIDLGGAMYDEMLALNYTEEMAALYKWMRGYNARVPEEDQLNFYGFDIQNTFAQVSYAMRYFNNLDVPINETNVKILSSILARTIETRLNNIADSNYIASFTAEMMSIYGVEQELVWGASYDDVKEPFFALIAEVEQQREALTTATSEEEYEVVIEVLHTIQNRLSTLFSAYPTFSDGWRDSEMQAKINWIVEREKQPVLIAGHNTHIASGEGYRPSTKWVGKLLAEQYGDAYYSIGTTFYKGEYAPVQDIFTTGGSFSLSSELPMAAYLNELPEDRYFVGFDAAQYDEAFKQMIEEPAKMIFAALGNEPKSQLLDNKYDTVLSEEFDAFISFRTISLYTPMKAPSSLTSKEDK